MFKAVVGHSEDVLTAEAAREAISQIKASLADRQPQAGLLFCSVDFDHAVLLAEIRTAFPGIQLVGCTTDGELSSSLGFAEDSLTLMAFVSDTVEIRAGAGRAAFPRGEAAGRDAAASAQAGMVRRLGQEKVAIILADPFKSGVSGVDKGLQAVLGKGFPVVGGVSAAHSKQRSTFQFYNDEVLTDSVVLLLFAGPVVYSSGIRGGHSPLGPKELVTKARGNVLYEIGHRPAVEYFDKYIGDCDLFMNYCLAVHQQDGEGFFVCSAPASDRAAGTVTLNGYAPEGSMVQIGTADKATLLQSCQESLRQALASYPGGRPAAALLVSCAGRKLIMGSQAARELQTVKRQLPAVPFTGFYSYGEFGPITRDGPFMFHGATFITLLLGEEPSV